LKILVTGAAGFIGSHVAETLVAAGHEVIGLDDLSTGDQANVPAGMDLHVHDIRGSRAADLVARVKPDVLCHHAAQVSVRRSVTDPATDADINVVGSLRMFEAARAAGCRRIVFASTGGAIYGEQSQFPAGEDHPARPVSPYGVAKLAVEHYLHVYAVEHGIRAACLRYANVYGPRQSPHGEAGVVAIFAGRMLRGEACTINGDGGQTRDFVYVGDVARANLAAIDGELAGAYNVGTGIETSVAELYALMARHVPNAPAPSHGPAQPGEQRRSSVDASKLAATGWRAETALADGLAQTISWFCAASTATPGT
jgi:UDP-glucose 4-epimerase